MILTAAGVIIAALGDFSFDFFGYCLALTSVFFQVNCYLHKFCICIIVSLVYSLAYIECFCMQTMYLVLVEKSGAEDGLSSVEIMFYNSFLSLPVLVFLILATKEFPDSLSLLLAKVT